eukprot:scaffold18787_cov49-Cylindrotheca_fusiformis.AAC.1
MAYATTSGGGGSGILIKKAMKASFPAVQVTIIVIGSVVLILHCGTTIMAVSTTSRGIENRATETTMCRDSEGGGF